MMEDIVTLKDIQKMVDTFYEKARKDELIGPVFAEKITDWEKHLQTMYTFWQTILLNEHTYHGAPFFKHISLPIQTEHFERWVALFEANVDENFSGAIAEAAKARARQFGVIFSSKMEFINANKKLNEN